MRYLKVGMIEALDLSAVVLVERLAGSVDVVVGAGSASVQFYGGDADAFLAAWRAYVAEMDGPVAAPPAGGGSRDLPGSDTGG